MSGNFKKFIWKIIPQRYTAKLTFTDIVDPILANIRYGFPGKKIKIIGITGTDGKTTTAYFLHAILTSWGKKAGLISTIEVKFGNVVSRNALHVTTPDAWQLNKILRQMIDDGCEYVVLEVTSHAIHQKRIWGLAFEAAGLTNITHEHLDVHNGSFEEYKKTKLSLLSQAKHSFRSQEVDESILDGISLKLTGDYNRLNAKLAAALAQQLGAPAESIKHGIESVTNVLGRMEVLYDKDFMVIVDFAHTPNGLETALASARKLVKSNGRLIAVFGSAGERDREKRPQMGAIAARLADIMILTAEDPRSEKVEDISNQIAQGAYAENAREGETLYFEADRTQAIKFAVNVLAKAGDVIMVTGKGPEESMNFEGKEYPWSDFEAVRNALPSDSLQNKH